MLQSLKRSLKLINKDSLEKVIWKAIQNDNFDPPQKKHLTFIITVLLGLNERIHQYQAFAKILDICYSTFQSTNWLQALKLCSLFHESFQANCIDFAKTLIANHIFQRLKKVQTQSSEVIICIQLTLFQNYLGYLELYSQNLVDHSQFQLNQMLSSLKLLVKMNRDLDNCLKGFSQVLHTQSIVSRLIQDLKKYYPLAIKETENEISNIYSVSPDKAISKYQYYEDLIKLTRGIRKLCELGDETVAIYTVDFEKNKKLELYAQKLKMNQKSKINENTTQIFLTKDIIQEEQKLMPTLQFQTLATEPRIDEIKMEESLQQKLQLNLNSPIFEIPEEIKYVSLERQQIKQRSSFGFRKQQNFSKMKISDGVFGIRKEVSRTSRAQSNLKSNFYDTKINPLSFLQINPSY